MKKAIRFERRTSNSPRLHFNRVGDWRPRVIVWPEYDGLSKDEFGERSPDFLDEDTDNAWGRIVAAALAQFTRRHSLAVFAFELTRPTLWDRVARQQVYPSYKRSGRFDLTADYVNGRQRWGHEAVVFLLAPPVQQGRLPHIIRSPVLDRANLLPYGEAIFDLGTEEAVLEITFDRHDASFLEALRDEANAQGHLCEPATVPFVSHWVAANHLALGDNWRVF